MAQLILRIALPSPLRRLFDYLAPKGVGPEKLTAGVRLRVPFGKREMVGVLVETTTQSDIELNKLKPALELLDDEPAIPEPLFRLCLWTATYYQHSLGDTLSWALPVLLRQGEPAASRHELFWSLAPDAQLDDPRLARAPRQRDALRTIAQHPHGVANKLLGKLMLSRDSLMQLKDKGLVTTETREIVHPAKQGPWLAQPELLLNDEQQHAVECIELNFGRFHASLLAGVTGSGKTEVYLHLIHRTLQQGKQALVLIPEINLGPQTLERFAKRFNARIALLHSAVNDRERLDAWIAAREGDAQIIIGTRSALFTPMKNPGLIIIDEEHDSSYKQQEGLRYNARDLAVVRASQEQIPIVLGSATPSLESLHNAQIGRYQRLNLTQRAGSAQAPSYLRLDVKSLPLEAGISQPLQKAMQQTLEAGKQVLVFLNRRGFAPTLLCHDCGWMSTCSRCDARMTLHQRSGELRCHHCGHTERPPRSCPECQKVDLRPVGAGTERAEERLATLFPAYPVIRVDRDTTGRKDALEKLFQMVHTGAPCLLVGTQMLAKGHHFPNVTLVAILDADGGLFSADFRASERMAQLITQVAGRAGRADTPGKVIIQSHLADHPLLMQLTEKGYFAFADQALSERQDAHLPPFSHLALLRAEAHKPGQAETFLDESCALAEALLTTHGLEVELLGPIPAPMERRAGRFRAQLLFQATARAPLHQLLRPLMQQLESLPSGRSVRWSLDVDPIDLF